MSASPVTGGQGVAVWQPGQQVSLDLGKGIAPISGEVTMNVLREDGSRSVRLDLGTDEESGQSTGEFFGNLDRDGAFQGYIRYREDAGVYRLSKAAGEQELIVRRMPVENLICSFDAHRPDGMLTPEEALAPAAAVPPTQVTPPVVTAGEAVISVGDVRMAEGQTKGNVMQFPVISGVASGSGKTAITVQWTLVGESATSGTDFKKASGKLTLAKGKTQGTISVTTVPDRANEGDETFKVVLSSPTNATLGKAEGIGTILDDEWSSTVTPTSPPVLQEPVGDVAKQKAAYSVPFTVSPPVQEAVTFSWALSGGTATAGKDFTTASGTVKLAAGQGTFTIPVTVLGDGFTEPEEAFSVQFSKLPAMITAPAAEVKIAGAAPVVSTPSPVPALQSRPGATKVIYLELNGATLTGTAWNKTNAPITTASVYSKFGDQGCHDIWITVAEAYRAFDVNVTTDKTVFDSTPAGNRTWCLFNSEPSKFNSSAAGVGYVGVFGQPTYQPALAFTTGDYTIDSYGTIAIHELGHNLGLNHDGKGTQEYYDGHQGARFSWGPWMGTPYYKFYRQFSIGDYAGATNHEDDLALIGNYLPVVADEAGNTLNTAADLPLQSAGDTPTMTGIITSRTDVDSYRLVLGATQAVTITLDADQDGSYSLAPGMKIYDASGNIAVPSSSGWTDTGGVVTWTGTLAAGTYRVDVDGIGDPSDPGYSDYGAIGAYSVQATAP
ncbi:MAG: Calx-beta domain-containing protein [Luteolibacter sp.]